MFTPLSCRMIPPPHLFTVSPLSCTYMNTAVALPSYSQNSLNKSSISFYIQCPSYSVLKVGQTAYLTALGYSNCKKYHYLHNALAGRFSAGAVTWHQLSVTRNYKEMTAPACILTEISNTFAKIPTTSMDDNKTLM